MNISGTLASINGLHDAGRNERRNIAFEIGIIFIGGLALFVMAILLPVGPTLLVTAKGGVALTSTIFDAFSFRALDSSGMAQFVAVAGVVLALNRFDRHSPDELGMEVAVKLSTRLDFRSLVQFVLMLVAATAPYRAITWIVLHSGDPGWNQQAAASAGTCVILWLLLLLAAPAGSVCGLQNIQRQWHLAEVIHRAGRLEQAWGKRWGHALHDPVANRFLPLRIAVNWSLVMAGITIAFLFLTWVASPGYEFWLDPEYARFAIVLAVYLSLIGFVGLAVSVGFALLSMKEENQGSPAAAIAKWLAAAVPFLFGVGTATALGKPYIPALCAVLLVTGVQYACMCGILRKRRLLPRAWSPVRQLTLCIRQMTHYQAHTHWALLQSRWSSGVEKLPRREAKKAIKEARRWRTKHGLELPFFD
ncbi:hypothetical protein [Arthrobacter sp. Y81]|uniref:hypothetical protein n=1 Tax=Arthrobacter sp. Y81 TaxID=2058897 RepID=UPI0011B0630D|nr:hypothetical protein [Arthrobacter sp. Y81]